MKTLSELIRESINISEDMSGFMNFNNENMRERLIEIVIEWSEARAKEYLIYFNRGVALPGEKDYYEGGNEKYNVAMTAADKEFFNILEKTYGINIDVKDRTLSIYGDIGKNSDKPATYKEAAKYVDGWISESDFDNVR